MSLAIQAAAEEALGSTGSPLHPRGRPQRQRGEGLCPWQSPIWVQISALPLAGDGQASELLPASHALSREGALSSWTVEDFSEWLRAKGLGGSIVSTRQLDLDWAGQLVGLRTLA